MNRANLRAEAVLAAEYVLADIGHEPGTRVDVFSVIEDRRIWLMFDRFEDVLGMYTRVEDTAGIAINLRRPAYLQRFTAAHELGHHELGHRSSCDDETNVLGRVNDPQEMQAQIFAANLLMSESSIEAALETQRLDPMRPAHVSPAQAYLMSAQLGVSYEALLVQLVMLDRISWSDKHELAAARPKRIKQSLLQGHDIPGDARRNIVQIDLAQHRSSVSIGANDLLLVELPAHGQACVDWQLADSTANQVDVLMDTFRAPDAEPSLFQGDGHRLLLLQPVKSGELHLTVELTGALHTDETESFAVEVIVEQQRLPQVGRGVSTRQHDQLLSLGV
jgi:Zn-dependent peptidase ImmA (M78 family)